jgi:hypothetical protein
MFGRCSPVGKNTPITLSPLLRPSQYHLNMGTSVRKTIMIKNPQADAVDKF